MRSGTFFLSKASESDVCNYGWKLSADKPGVAVRFVRGKKMRTVDALFDEFSSACQFPYYFHDNWPSFCECLGDLDWIPSSNLVLIITSQENVLTQEPSDMGAFARALKNSSNSYNGKKNNAIDQESVFKIIMTSEFDVAPNEIILSELGNPARLSI